MSKNVSIMSLLSQEPANDPPKQGSSLVDIKKLVSRYQTDIKMGNDSAISIDDSPIPQLQPSPLPKFTTAQPTQSSPQTEPSIITIRDSSPESVSSQKNVDLTNQISRFKADFQFEPPKKTSISSIMNYDKPLVEEPKEIKPVVTVTKKTNKKAELKKSDAKKPEPKKGEKRKLEKKPPANSKKKKTPESNTPVQPKETINVPPPEIIEIEKKEETNKKGEKPKEKPKEPEKSINNILEPEKKEQKELPIIALNIPLLDPKNPKSGQSEVIVNVLKLAEDKYGWSAVHPEAKSAIDTMDDLIEEDDDNEEEEIEIEDDKKKKEENLTEEQLVKRHEAKMNRKVGKYDYEDPFIDDDELQWEESISSTKEGFFVYWGPLIEERNVKKIAKKR